MPSKSIWKADYLKEQYGLTGEKIVAQAKNLVNQKANVGVNV
ncbi:hypothetical protein [Trichococcus alkaliphilus]|nr:hypothetical protein [Trichococcus alkaliphilus]